MTCRGQRWGPSPRDEEHGAESGRNTNRGLIRRILAQLPFRKHLPTKTLRAVRVSTLVSPPGASPAAHAAREGDQKTVIGNITVSQPRPIWVGTGHFSARLPAAAGLNNL